MNLFASRTLVHTGEPVEIEVSFVCTTRLKDEVLKIIRPDLSMDEDREEPPLGPVRYRLEEISTNYGGETALILRKIPEDTDAMEARFRNAATKLGIDPDSAMAKQIREIASKPAIDPATGIDPADYMHGRSHHEIRISRSEFEAGTMSIYFENDNSGFFRTRRADIHKDKLSPATLALIERAFKGGEQVAKADKTPDPSGKDPG